MKILFWACLSLIAYTYLIYPYFVITWARHFPRKSQVDAAHTPSVSMVVVAYNEEDILEHKIENCLGLDYPPEKIEFLFASDGSTDRTDEILRACHAENVKPFLYPERRGKTSVINTLVPEANGEILIFSDANSIYQPSALKKLVRYFSDPEVGGVCGRLELLSSSADPGGQGEGLYWNFENRIKEAEGAIQSVIGANGAIYAIKTVLFQPLPTKTLLMDDFMITLQLLQQGYRVIYEPRAIATESTSPDMESEFTRKIRIAAANFNALPFMLKLLTPSQGFNAMAIFSHKILRWMVPFLAAGMLVSNILLLKIGGIYRITIAFQGIIYAGAFLGYLGDRLFRNSGPFIPFYYLAMINVALLIGFWRSITGTQKIAWKRVPH